MENFIKERKKFASTNSVNQIAYYSIAPRENPIAVLQFCHGMAEHSKRYEAFGEFLASQGIVFCICDHLGHGESINSEADLGYFAKKDGWRNLVEDAAKFTVIMKQQYPNIPYFIAGHSMGSFVARAYLSTHGELVDGGVIIGTGNATPLIAAGVSVSKLIAFFKGERYRSKLLDKLSFGGYTKRIADVRTSSDWLSRDAKHVDQYRTDPLCGFIFTASGFKDVSTMMRFVSTKKWAESVPKNLPIFLLAGDQDPVGEYGAGVKKVSTMLQTSGVKDVTLKLYEGGRHEILNETNYNEVYTDIASWILKNQSNK